MICAGWIRLRCVGLPGLTNGSMTPWRCAGFCRGSAFRFFGRQRIGAMADRRHHGEGEHHQGEVAMPPMPGSALVVIEPELVFRGLKTVLEMLDDIIAYDIAQGIRIQIHAAQDRLLTPWAGIASRLGAHPTGLALLI